MAIRRNGNAVNMTDVALKAGVSQSTVSRVLNNQPSISRHTRTTVLETASGNSDTKPAPVMRNPKPKKRLPSVWSCVLCREQNDPFALEYFATVASGIRETLEKVGARLRLQTLPAGAAELPGATTAEGVILARLSLGRTARRPAETTYCVHHRLRGHLQQHRGYGHGQQFRGERGGLSLPAPAGHPAHRFSDGSVRAGTVCRFPDGIAAQLTQCQAGRLPPSTEYATADFHRSDPSLDRGKRPAGSAGRQPYRCGRAIKTMLLLNGFRIPEDIQLVAFDHHPERVRKSSACIPIPTSSAGMPLCASSTNCGIRTKPRSTRSCQWS